jgi:hypothetical protein
MVLGFLEQQLGAGTVFYKKKNNGFDETHIENDPLAGVAKGAVVISYVLASIWFFVSFVILCPSFLNLINYHYAEYVRKRRCLSVTEKQIELEKHLRARQNRSGGGADQETSSKLENVFWGNVKYLHQAG